MTMLKRKFNNEILLTHCKAAKIPKHDHIRDDKVETNYVQNNFLSLNKLFNHKTNKYKTINIDGEQRLIPRECFLKSSLSQFFSDNHYTFRPYTTNSKSTTMRSDDIYDIPIFRGISGSLDDVVNGHKKSFDSTYIQRVWVVEDNSRIIAAVDFSIYLSSQCLIVENLGVKDSYQGQGLGLKLLALVLKVAINFGIKNIDLCPTSSAELFYLKLGFRPTYLSDTKQWFKFDLDLRSKYTESIEDLELQFDFSANSLGEFQSTLDKYMPNFNLAQEMTACQELMSGHNVALVTSYRLKKMKSIYEVEQQQKYSSLSL